VSIEINKKLKMKMTEEGRVGVQKEFSFPRRGERE